jgi:hypothetical protein
MKMQISPRKRKLLRKPFSALAKVYYEFFSDSSRVKYVPNYRADISLKQRCANKATVFVLDQSRSGVPILQGRNGTVKAQSVKPIINSLKTKIYDPFEASDVRNEATARSRRSTRPPSRNLAVHSRWHYLSEDECRRIITRIVNRLNRRLFKGRACRTHNPERVTVLACMHDKNSRRHFHLLFGIPTNVSEFEFKQSLNDALAQEPFVYRRRKVGRIVNLANSIGYNVEPTKSQDGNPVIFQAWQPPRKEQLNEDTIMRQDDRDNLTPAAA